MAGGDAKGSTDVVHRLDIVLGSECEDEGFPAVMVAGAVRPEIIALVGSASARRGRNVDENCILKVPERLLDIFVRLDEEICLL